MEFSFMVEKLLSNTVTSAEYASLCVTFVMSEFFFIVTKDKGNLFTEWKMI